jgi:hypothetical protein
MALANYSDLLTAIETFRERAGDSVVSGNAADFLTLAEAELNRRLVLNQLIVETTLTGSASSRELTLPTDHLEPRWLELTTWTEPIRLNPETADDIVRTSSNAVPRSWCINGDAIDLNCPLDQAHTFRFRYRQRLDLASDTTNWLMTNNPDVYLAAVMVWSGMLLLADDIAVWDAKLRQAIDDLGQIESRSMGGVATLSVDHALQAPRGYDVNTGGFA